VLGAGLHPVSSICVSHTVVNMQYEFHPQLHQFSPFYGIVNQPVFSVNLNTTQTIESVRLRHEKEILEDGLADCVTYLHALRKKQARIERILGLEPILTRKKRKQMLQRKYELDREIKNRQRDEEAFLSNLQTCKINIHLAEGLLYTPTGPLSAVPDCTSSTTQFSCEESAPTEMSWNGWTEDTLTSPFEKTRSRKSFAHELAPDELEEAAIIAVPPNPVHPQHSHFALSPEAVVFEPGVSSAVRGDGLRPSPSQITDSRSAMSAKQYTEAELCSVLQGLSLDKGQLAKQGRSHTWSQAASQRGQLGDTRGRKMRRTKTNPL
jgi:hypothetical protein